MSIESTFDDGARPSWATGPGDDPDRSAAADRVPAVGAGPRTGTDDTGSRWVEVHPNHWHAVLNPGGQQLEVSCTGARDDGALTTAELQAGPGLRVYEDDEPGEAAGWVEENLGPDAYRSRQLPDRPVDITVQIEDEAGPQVESGTRLLREAADDPLVIGAAVGAHARSALRGFYAGRPGAARLAEAALLEAVAGGAR